MRPIRTTPTRSTTTTTDPTAPASAAPARRRRRIAGLAVTRAAGVAVSSLGLGAAPASANPGIGGIGDKNACPPTEIHVKADQKVVTGTCGNDLIFVGFNNNVTVNSLGGDDDIRGGWGAGHTVTVNSGPGNDSIHVNPDKRLVADGGSGNDDIEGGNADDVLVGGEGDDHLVGSNGGNILNGAGGNDILDSTDWGSQAFEPDWVIGGLGWDLADWQVGDVKDASVEGGNAHA
jgi:Ca2+-binding RTX toxin-like protein